MKNDMNLYKNKLISMIMLDELKSKIMAWATGRRRWEEVVDESGRNEKGEGKFRISLIKPDRLILTQLKLRIENTKKW